MTDIPINLPPKRAAAWVVIEAARTDQLLYLYQLPDDSLVASDEYRKDWLFKAWPGGRKVLSGAGRDLIMPGNLLSEYD